MISSIFVLTLATAAIRAALVPTAPGPGQVFNEGGDCTISWNLDTSGRWNSFNVDLMTGSNLAMQPVTNVFKNRDGTKGDTTYTWKCPQVTPHSTVYFYQFTQTGADTTWTTRFTIASPSGEVTPPPNPTQPGGAAIPWGIGRLSGTAASSTNATVVAPPAGSNTTALLIPPTANNTTNSTENPSTVPLNNTTGTATGGPSNPSTTPSTTLPSTVPSSRNVPSTPNTGSTSNTNPTPASTSDAPFFMMSNAVITTMVLVTSLIIA